MVADRRKSPRDCKKCGTLFQPKAGASANPSYCSRDCFLAAHPRHFCHGCKTQKTAADFHRSKHRPSGHVSKCKVCYGKLSISINKRPPQKASFYKFSAKKRGLEYLLTKEDFLGFWQKPCYYCTDPIETIGLDRIDNTKGYTMGNVVPCCAPCNMMKGTMPAQEFITRCARILATCSSRIKEIV